MINGSQPSNPDTASVVTFWSGEDSASVLTGFTITGGKGTILSPWEYAIPPHDVPLRSGGGILIQESGCKIMHNIIRENILLAEGRGIQAWGGGIFADYSSDTVKAARILGISDNVISDNKLYGYINGGGGIYILVDSSSSESDLNISVARNIISHNRLFGNDAEPGLHGSAITMTLGLPVRKGVFNVMNNEIRQNSSEIIHPAPARYWEFGTVYITYIGESADQVCHAPMIYNNVIEGNTVINNKLEEDADGTGLIPFGLKKTFTFHRCGIIGATSGQIPLMKGLISEPSNHPSKVMSVPLTLPSSMP